MSESDKTPGDEKEKQAKEPEASTSPLFYSPAGAKAKVKRNTLGQYEKREFTQTPKKDRAKAEELLKNIEDMESTMSTPSMPEFVLNSLVPNRDELIDDYIKMEDQVDPASVALPETEDSDVEAEYRSLVWTDKYKSCYKLLTDVMDMELNAQDKISLRSLCREGEFNNEGLLCDGFFELQSEYLNKLKMKSVAQDAASTTTAMANHHNMNIMPQYIETAEIIKNLPNNFTDKMLNDFVTKLKQNRAAKPAGHYIDADLAVLITAAKKKENIDFGIDDVPNMDLNSLLPILRPMNDDFEEGTAALHHIKKLVAPNSTSKSLSEFYISLVRCLERCNVIPEQSYQIWKEIIYKFKGNDNRYLHLLTEARKVTFDDSSGIDPYLALIWLRVESEQFAEKISGVKKPQEGGRSRSSGGAGGGGKQPSEGNRGDRGDRPPVVCFNCGKKGHFGPKCYDLGKDGYPNAKGKEAKAKSPGFKGRNPGYLGSKTRINPDYVGSDGKVRLPVPKKSKVRFAGASVGEITPTEEEEYEQGQINMIVEKHDDFQDTLKSLENQTRKVSSTGYSKCIAPLGNFTEPVRSKGQALKVGLDTKAHRGNWIDPILVRELKLELHDIKPMEFSSPINSKEKTFISRKCVRIQVRFTRFDFLVDLEFRIFPEKSKMSDRMLIGQEDIVRYDLIRYHLLANDNQLFRPEENQHELVKEIESRLKSENCLWSIINSDKGLKAELAETLSALDPNDKDYESLIDMLASDMIAKEFPLEHFDELKEVLKWAIREGVITDRLDGSTMDVPPFHVPFRPDATFEGVPPRQYSLAKTEVIRAWLEKLLSMNIICKSDSLTTSPVLVVQQDSKYRVTIDQRLLNEKLVRAHGSINNMKQVVEGLGAHEYYGRFDLLLAYYQIPSTPEMRSLFAFSTPYGNYEFTNSLPMGEKNIPSHFTKCMREILKDLPAAFPNYFDDVFSYGDTPEEFISNVKALMEKFKNLNVRVSLSKILVGSSSISALGFEIDKKGYRPKQEIIEKAARQDFPKLKNIRSYLGLINVFSPFIKNLPELIAPFKDVRKKNAVWEVTEEMTAAHEKIKLAVQAIPKLHFLDNKKQIYIECDASDYGSGAILYQLDDEDNKEIVRITSTTFTPAAMKWSTIQKEAFAIMKALLAFENIIDGRNVKILTDHRNLMWMSKVANKMVSRWYDYVVLFDVDIIHLPGVENEYADALSRLSWHIEPIPPNTVSSIIKAAGGGKEEEESSDDDSEDEAVPELTNLHRYISTGGNKRADELSRVIEEKMPELVPLLQEEIEEKDEATFKDLFDTIHNSIMGHFGVQYTTQNMRDAGADPKNIQQRVIDLISKCATCIKSRKKLAKTLRERHSITASTPFAIFECDHITGLPTSDKGNNSILLIMDSFTRFTYVYPCASTNAETVKEALLQVYSYFGTPLRLRSDGGAAFIEKGLQDFLTAINCDHNTTVAHHPQSHGQIEVQNRETIRHFRNLLQDSAKYDAKNWDTTAPLIASVLNNKIHAATGYSPFNLLFGSEHALRHSANHLENLDRTNADAYLRKLDNALRLANEYASESQDFLTITNYEKHPAVEQKFKVGDLILIPNRIGDRKKLSLPLAGPYKIEAETDSKDIFRIRDITQDKYNYGHSCTFILFPYVVPKEDELRIAAEDYGEYKFRILGHQGNPKKKTTIFVKVQWEDKFDSISWIPLATCKDVIAVRDYFKSFKEFKNVCSAPDLTPARNVRQKLVSSKLNDPTFDTTR